MRSDDLIKDFLENNTTFKDVDNKLLEDCAYKIVTDDYTSLVLRITKFMALPLKFVVVSYTAMKRRLRSGKAILPDFVPEYKHNKTENDYCVILEQDVMIESTWRPGVLYMNAEGVLIVRDKEEFNDGRFTKIVPEKVVQETSN